MGGQQSKPPPIIKEDPSPNQAPVDGIGVGGKTQGCQVCRDQRRKRGCTSCKFYIGQGVSAASAKLYRESGNVTQEQCNALSVDLEKVKNNELAFDQVRAKLIDGKYFQNLNNGYCGQLYVKAGEEKNVTDPASLSGRLIQPSILKMTIGGGYSSLTKLFIKPSVPFNITLNNVTETVDTMTLFHPAPLRIENVQYDAVLTLNDTADTTKKLVALIPLKGSLKPGEGGRFLSKIASHLTGILRPNPTTNQYDPIDVPTGNDWDLSRIFPGKPDPVAKKTATTDGFFTWKSVPPIERYLKREQKFGNFPIADIYEYGWRPVAGAEGPMYVMLQSPIEVGVFDLQTIRMLPVTPTEDAMPPPLLPTVTYTPPTECKKNSVLPGVKETFDTKGAACDPFAAMESASTITSDTIFSAVLGVMTAIAVFIGLYFALKYASDNNWGTKIQEWGRKAGKYFATAPPPGSDTAPAPAPAPPAAPSGGPRPSRRRQGEDFAFTNDAAIELRRRKKAEQEELARLKKEADAAAAKATAEEAAEMERLRKEAEENAQEARDQATARAEIERKQEEAAKAQLAKFQTGINKRVRSSSGNEFEFTSPLAERAQQKRAEQAELARLKKEADEAAAKAKAEEAAELEKLRRQAETERRRGEAAGTGLLSREELQANADRAKREEEQVVRVLRPGEPGYDELRKQELAAKNPKQLKRRVIKSSDRDLTADEQEQKKKDEAMVARATQPKKDYESRTPAATASSPSSSATPPPAEDAKKKAEIDRKLKALQDQLVEIQKRKETARVKMRAVVDARNKAKTLRASPPKVPSQAQREIDRLEQEIEEAASAAETAAKETEQQAQRQQRFLATVQGQLKQIQDASAQKRLQTIETQLNKAETEAVDVKEQAETERENVARDLAAAQSRLRSAQSVYTRATQRRNLTTGKGRTKRTRKH